MGIDDHDGSRLRQDGCAALAAGEERRAGERFAGLRVNGEGTGRFGGARISLRSSFFGGVPVRECGAAPIIPYRRGMARLLASRPIGSPACRHMPAGSRHCDVDLLRRI